LIASTPDPNSKEELGFIPGTPPNMVSPPKGDAFAIRNIYAREIDFKKQPPMFKVNETHSAAT
jgi:oligopeptide transport system ATP-binding protein